MIIQYSIESFKILWLKVVIQQERAKVNVCRTLFITNFIEGGESIYGAPFADEFHQRIRFNHRGQVACANSNTPNSNGSQFFITFDSCEWLKKKHTIFGKVLSFYPP